MYRTLLLLCLLLTPLTYAEVIKKSKSGICHSSASAFYERTKRFTPFDTLEACLDSGGRLPKGMTAQQSQMNKAISEANEQGRAYSRIYDRNEWPHWEDPDNNGCDSRKDALIAQADGPVTLKKGSRCDVIAGTWYLPYSGETYTGPSRELDADHLIPLSFAFKHGGADWNHQKKLLFSNDPDNITIASAKYNRQKSDSGPSSWMPPLQSYRCEYLSRFDDVMKKYQLKHTASELRILKRMHNACQIPAPYAG